MEMMSEKDILNVDPNAFLLPGAMIVAAGEVYCRQGTVYTKMELRRSSIETAAYAAWREEYSRNPGTLRFGQAFHNHFALSEMWQDRIIGDAIYSARSQEQAQVLIGALFEFH